MIRQKIKKYKTYLTYFCSYIAVLLLSVTVLFFVVQFDLKTKANDLYRQDLQQKIEHLSEMMSNDFLAMFHSYNSIKENMALLNNSYTTNGYRAYLMQNELRKYLQSSPLLQDIVLIDSHTNQVFSVYYNYDSEPEQLLLRYNSDQQFSIPYSDINFDKSSLLYLNPTDDVSFLFFIPEQFSSSFRLIFLVDRNEWINLIKTVINDQTLKIDLYDLDGNYLFSPYQRPDTSGLKKSSYPTLQADCDYPPFTLEFTYSNQMFSTEINNTFRTTYLILFFLLLLGLGAIVTLTHFVYAPHRLFAKFLSENIPNSSGDPSDYLDFKTMEQAFQSIQTENHQLLERLTLYRSNMQKSLLESCEKMGLVTPESIQRVEQLFTAGQCQLMVVHYQNDERSVLGSISNALEAKIQPELHAIPLDVHENGQTLLLIFPLAEHSEATPDEELQSKINNLLDTGHCKIDFSQSSCNPLDIPRLYEEATLPTNAKRHTNIYSLVDSFEDLLCDQDYIHAEQVMDSIFDALDDSQLKYFIQSVLLTVLNVMVQAFTAQNISISYYSSEYDGALYWCRTIDYPHYRSEITTAYHTLLKLLSDQPGYEKLTKETFSQYIQKEFCNSTFSINQLGDHFRISGSYISYWFKKNYGQNLSDYLWILRFNYALELMKDPKNAMADISARVGYDNYSSFRRKFKTHCGLSPSEYRKQHFDI